MVGGGRTKIILVIGAVRLHLHKKAENCSCDPNRRKTISFVLLLMVLRQLITSFGLTSFECLTEACFSILPEVPFWFS